jgi:hypothetical protein
MYFKQFYIPLNMHPFGIQNIYIPKKDLRTILQARSSYIVTIKKILMLNYIIINIRRLFGK